MAALMDEALVISKSAATMISLQPYAAQTIKLICVNDIFRINLNQANIDNVVEFR